MWQTFETIRHLSVYSVLSNWSANGLGGNGSGRALDALLSLDSSRVMATCATFPLRRSLAVQEEDADGQGGGRGQGKQWGDKEEKGYDPVFVLNLLGAVLAASAVPPKSEGEEGVGAANYEEEEAEPVYRLSGLDWVEILRSDTLGLAVCAMASRDEGVRRLAGYVLGRSVAQIQVSI